MIDDPLITRKELQRRLGRSSSTIRAWLKAKRLPPPDIAMTRETQQWKLSTLRAAGLNL